MSTTLSERMVLLVGAIVVATALSCSKSTRLYSPDYTAIAPTSTEPLEIITHDGARYIVRNAVATDSTLTILKGEVTTKGGPKVILSSPVILHQSNIEATYLHEIDSDKSLLVVLGVVLLALGVAALGAFPAGV